MVEGQTNKDERQSLIEAMEAGNNNDARQAGRLLKRYPDTAVAALITGAREAQGYTLGSYVRLLGQVLDDTALTFLEDVMRGSADSDGAPMVAARVFAAEVVAARDEDLSGVRVTLTVQKSSTGTRDPRYAQTQQNVTVDDVSVYNTSGGHDRHYVAEADIPTGIFLRRWFKRATHERKHRSY